MSARSAASNAGGGVPDVDTPNSSSTGASPGFGAMATPTTAGASLAAARSAAAAPRRSAAAAAGSDTVGSDAAECVIRSASRTQNPRTCGSVRATHATNTFAKASPHVATVEQRHDVQERR